jgi:hypothetical protein
MRPDRLRLGTIAAWLGVIALSFNAVVPIRLAFGLAIDFAQARECGHHEDGPPTWHDPGWALSLLTGYDLSADPSRSHPGFHPIGGAVCGVIGGPTGFTPAAAAKLALPLRLEEARTSPLLAEVRPNSSPPSGYRSRAPPSPAAELIH